MTARPYQWTGTMRRGTEPGTIFGVLADTMNYTITITGTRQPDGSYACVGIQSAPPDEFRIPLMDDEG